MHKVRGVESVVAQVVSQNFVCREVSAPVKFIAEPVGCEPKGGLGSGVVGQTVSYMTHRADGENDPQSGVSFFHRVQCSPPYISDVRDVGKTSVEHGSRLFVAVGHNIIRAGEIIAPCGAECHYEGVAECEEFVKFCRCVQYSGAYHARVRVRER